MKFDFSHFNNQTWFPGHMLKASREIKGKLKLVDLALLLADSRIPESSINNDLEKQLGEKARMIVLNKSDMADVGTTKQWVKSFEAEGISCVHTSVLKNKGVTQILNSARDTIKEDRRKRGATRPLLRPFRLLIMGVPNVGKSSLINALAKKNRAKTGRTPGVTKHQQWIKLTDDIELLDTPGIMMPGSLQKERALKMGLCHIIRQDLLGTEILCEYLLYQLCRNNLLERLSIYKIDTPENITDLLTGVAVTRGCILPGGGPDLTKASLIVLKDYSDGKLGTFSLDLLDENDVSEEIEVKWK